MTFEDLEGRVIRRLQLNANTILGDDPFLRQDTILKAVDRIAEETWCLYGERTTSLVADENTYCLPEFFRVDNVLCADENYNWFYLTQFDSETEMDALNGSYWRNDTATVSVPGNAIWENVNRVILYQTPATSRTAAFKFEGFYKPMSVWERSAGIAVPFARDQDCPLPDWAWEAAVSEAVSQCAEMDDRPYVLRQAERLREEADKARGEVEAKVMVYHSRTFARVRNPYTFRR
jgi:hypothetical protein